VGSGRDDGGLRYPAPGWDATDPGALLDRDRAKPLGRGGDVQGLVRAHGVVLAAPGIHRGLRGFRTVEGTVGSSSSPWML
jgi:hypothetical protein